MLKRGPKRTRAQRIIDQSKIADLYLAGKEQLEIANVLGVSQQQISHDLKKVKRIWEQSIADRIEAHRAEDLAKIRQLERKYREVYERSLEEFKARTISGKPDGEKLKATSQTIHTENRCGNIRALDGILKCIERRCKLLGLDAPEKREHAGKDGGPIQIEDHFKGWTREDVIKYIISGDKPASSQ